MCEKKKAGIIGLGMYVPENILTNKELEKMVDTTDEWIVSRTGIKERHIARSDEATSDMAVNAAKEALKDAHLDPEDIDLIIVATITPDMFFPATACVVQAKLGARQIPAFDISVACSGFIYGLAIASQFISSGTYKHALIIAAEKLSAITDWNDRSTCVLFGDGAGAAVLSSVEEGGILSISLGANGHQGDLIKLPAGGSRIPATKESIEGGLHFIKMNGSELFKHAVKIMADAALSATAPLGLKAEDIKLVIPHQANERILNAAAKRMGLKKDQIYLNLDKYGNMSAASSAVALAEAVKKGLIKKGDKIVLDAFGGGLTWGAMVIEWSK
jgi:3-oxoacyl-[acyl-carrier-protein] synthase-3